MLLLSRIMIAMLLAVVVHYVVGDQIRVVQVSESVSYNDDFSSTSGEHNNSHVCCVYGNCTCNSLDQALANLTSNVLINITNDVTLSSIIERSKLQNVSIIGYNNPTVNCKTGAGIHFKLCHDCIIQGITWNKCGSATTAGLMLNDYSNIIIQNCSFQNSLGQAVVLSEVSGNVNINNCNFVNNSQYRGHGTGIHYYSKDSVPNFVFNINNCKFSHNKQATSLLYFENGFQHSNITLSNSVFQDNKGVSCIFLVNQKILVNGKVLFLNNSADNGTGIFINDNSTIVFGENSDVSFICNSADTAGGAIFSRNRSIVLFNENSKVKFSSNLAGMHGAAICSLDNSQVIFTGNSKVEFNSNVNKDHNQKLRGIIYIEKAAYIAFECNATAYFSNNTALVGGAIFAKNDCHISLKGNSRLLFSNNTADFGGAVYLRQFSSICLGGNSTTMFNNNAASNYGGAIRAYDNSNIFFKENSTTVFNNNNNPVSSYGGAIGTYNNSNVYFEGNFITNFSNNNAVFGGAVYLKLLSNIYFEGNSTTVFKNNTASGYGGAIYPYVNSNVNFEGKSKVWFSNNSAKFGGAVHLRSFSNIHFKENSITVFNNNTASDLGGALYPHNNSNIYFEGNSDVQFINNRAEWGAAVYIRRFGIVYLKGNSITVFNSNTASDHGGAIRSYDNSDISFEGNSTTLFNNNSASSYYGGAIRTYNNCSVSFKGHSVIYFSNNSAVLGGAMYSKKVSNIYFEGNSTTVFNNNTASYAGAIRTIDNSNVFFQGNSTTQFNGNNGIVGAYGNSNIFFKENSATVFSNNNALYYGAVASTELNSDIIFDGNSKINITNNTATKRTTFYSVKNSKILARGNSSVVFNDISAKWCNNVCLPYSIASTDHINNDVVIVDNHGIVRCSYQGGFTCQMKKCYCNEFERDIKDHSLVIIKDKVILSSPTPFTNLSSVSIFGQNNAFVYCVNDGRLTIMNSSNIVIKDITWIGCGKRGANQAIDDFTEMSFNNLDSSHSSEQVIDPVIYLRSSTNVQMQNCAFQYSEGRAVVMSELSGVVNISHCDFLNNSYYKSHGAAIHYTSGNTKSLNSTQCLFTINDCNFAYNMFAESLVHIENRTPKQNDIITISDCKFYHNQGVSIHVANEKVYLTRKILFSNNNATDGSGMYITNHSTVIFGENSDVAFTDNIANHRGSTVFLQSYSTILFDQNSKVTFHDSKSTTGTIYSEISSNVTFKGTCQVTFSSNSVEQHGAAIHSFDYSRITFKGNAKVSFKNNYVASPYNKIRHGGTIFSEDNSNVSFEENSTTVFGNNTANFGAAIFLFHKSNINLKDRSRVTFNDNTANSGGAVALHDNCTATIEQLSNLTFTDNFASQCGGALHFSHNSQVSFTDNSVTLFTDNRAEINGGAICYNVNSSIDFEKNSTIIFENNTASFGQSLYSNGSSYTVIRNANLIINNNTARWYKGDQFTNNSNSINDIIIDANGIVRCNDHNRFYICQYKKCYCENTNNIPSNAVVIITKNRTLSFPIEFKNKNNISLIGYNSSIHCENDSGFKFTSCSNVSITNLTWYKIIDSEKNISNSTAPQIEFSNSSDVTINHCTFQQSVGQAVVLSEVSGDVSIEHCKFVNIMHPLGKHGAAIHYSISCTEFSENMLTISDCYFTNNTGNASLIFLENVNKNYWCKSNILQNSDFNKNQLSCIYLSNQNLYIKGNVLFANNEADNGASIFINNHSNVTFGKASNVTFVKNAATINGGAIYVSNWSGIVFEKNSHVMFTSNEATLSGGTIYAENNSFIKTKGRSTFKISNSKANHGGAVYFKQSSNMSITENSTIDFTNNEAIKYGGCIYSDCDSIVTFKGHSKTTFYKSRATQGGVIYSCNNSGVILDKNSKVWFNYSSADELGGALYIETHSYIITKGASVLMIRNSEAIDGGASYLIHSSHMTFTENSTIMFLTSKAEEDGGGIYLNFNSSLIFKGNSIITITNNKATQGGAIYSTRGSNIDFDNNSTAIFNRNEATVNGGCIFTKQSHTQFRGTCRAIFNISVVFNGAGGAFCADNSSISFISGNVTFYKNTVYNGVGGAICCNKSIAIFEGTSDVRFDGNRATYGGAANFDLSSLIIRNNTVVTFSRNLATMSGAVNFNDNSNGTFEMNSTIVLRENSALQNGGAFYLASRCYIEFKGFVNVQFDNNNAIRGGAIFSIVSEIKFKNCSIVMFKNNAASQDGGAIYVSDESHLTFLEGSNVTFYHNRAGDYGGAIYSEMGNGNITFADSSNVTFLNNSAETTGSSVYMSLPRFCNSTCLTESVMVITKSMKDLERFIFTSPNKIKLYNSRLQCIDFGNDTECGEYYIKNIMLGQKILLDACMYDYYNHSVDVARFSLSGTTDNQGYYLESNNILITCNRTLELASIYGNESTQLNYSITLSLYDNHQSESKKVMIKLMVELSQCHPGFSYNKNLQKCECYNATEDIVFCSGSSSTIKRGYWFGNVTGKPTTAFCPINYCNFTCCETSNGYYHLSPVRDNQCSSHRSGTACGSCMDPYTLSYDSTKCVNVESCTTGHTVLVVLLTVIYWIVMVTLVFGIMYYKVGIGYLYGITYYYSIVDILLSQNMYASRGLYLTVNIMSSFSKIIPQFLGELCVVTGLSGIDQQFIHYIHPSAVITILIIISLIARRSQRISVFISRGIIHVICLLLLLSYTSIASTSLLLMRQLKFDGIDEVYTYLSPDIKFFHDRHLVYGIVALLFIIFIVIGPPLLLTLEPFLNHKLNFTKIKPLLDQFQGCYKDKYRCFAGYYMVCRLVIITIVIADSSNNFVANYLLITTCGIIALIHLLVKPYNSGILNKLDGVILQLIIFTEALSLFDDYDSPLVVAFSFLLVILPLLMIIGVAIFLHKDALQKRFRVRDKPRSKNKLLMADYHLIVSNDMRENATTCDVDCSETSFSSYRESFFETLSDGQD